MKNESSKHVGIRIPKRIFDLVEEHYPDKGWSQIVREALAEKIVREKGVSISASDLVMTQGARNDLPNRITEAEKRASRGRVKRAKKEVSRLALALGKSRTRAEAHSLADKAVNPHPKK